MTLKISLIPTEFEKGTAMVPMPCVCSTMEKYCITVLTEIRQESSPYQMEKDLTPSGRSVKFELLGYLSSCCNITQLGSLFYFAVRQLSLAKKQHVLAVYLSSFQLFMAFIHG